MILSNQRFGQLELLLEAVNYVSDTIQRGDEQGHKTALYKLSSLIEKTGAWPETQDFKHFYNRGRSVHIEPVAEEVRCPKVGESVSGSHEGHAFTGVVSCVSDQRFFGRDSFLVTVTLDPPIIVEGDEHTEISVCVYRDGFQFPNNFLYL